MSAVAFDTLKFATQLQAGDFTPDQARAITSALTEAMTGAELATKGDIGEVRGELQSVKTELQHEIQSVKTELQREIQSVKAELQGEIQALRTELHHEISGLRHEMKSDLTILEQRMTIRLGVMLMAAATFIIAAMKYLPGAHP